MTISAQAAILPFLYHFSKPLPTEPLLPLRYDPARQITQVLQNGQWIDTPDVPDDTAGASRKTAVRQETTDDE